MPIDQHCVQSLQRSCPAEVAGDDLGGKVDCRGVKIFYGVNARIWENPVSCCHITFFVGCSLLPPNRKSTGIRTIRTTPTLRGAIPSSRTETHTPNPLLPLDLHYSIRNVHPCRGSARTCDHVVVNDRSLFGRGPDIGKHGFKIRLVSQMNATLPARHKT